LATSVDARLVRVSGYCAALLPGAAISLSLHVHVLYRTPLALSFVLIGIIARTFGRGPAILAPAFAALCFNYVVALPEYSWTLSSQGLFETSIILILGCAIAYLFQGHRDGEQRLRSANKALRDRTSALIEAQKGSNSAAWKFDAATRRTSWYEGGSELFGRSLAALTALGSPVSLVVEEDRPRVAALSGPTAKSAGLKHAERLRPPTPPSGLA
jgi:hypothetical protein